MEKSILIRKNKETIHFRELLKNIRGIRGVEYADSSLAYNTEGMIVPLEDTFGLCKLLDKKTDYIFRISGDYNFVDVLSEITSKGYSIIEDKQVTTQGETQ